MSSTSPSVTVSTLKLLFVMHGLPDIIVSNNGTAFTSTRFQQFTHLNIIRYHCSSNGQGEHMVQRTKEALFRITTGDWQTRLARFPLARRTCLESPAELLMNR